MPGRASSCSLLAEFKSTKLPLAGAADCAAAEWLCGNTGTDRTNSSDATSATKERLSFRFINALLFKMQGEDTNARSRLWRPPRLYARYRIRYHREPFWYYGRWRLAL